MPAIQTIDEEISRTTSAPYSGRLIVLRQVGKVDSVDSDTLGLTEEFAIDFPSQPESIDLDRTANYEVSENMVIPDGVHQYTGTSPLEIPVSFELHYQDRDYCPEGALTLLKVAARLHSFLLPISTAGGFSVKVRVGDSGFDNGVEEVPSTGHDDDSLGANAIGSNVAPDFSIEDADSIFYPVTLRLELMYVDDNSPGIVCTGYIKSVGVKLKGPFMKGPGNSRNLPTKAEYSFTFVHVPGYGNNYNSSAGSLGFQRQAFANTVKDQLYNTRSLSFGGGYRGLSESDLPVHNLAVRGDSPQNEEESPTHQVNIAKGIAIIDKAFGINTGIDSGKGAGTSELVPPPDDPVFSTPPNFTKNRTF